MFNLKRIGLFLLTNVLVLVTISIVINLLGIRPYLTASGIDYGALLAFCFAWGMAGALISLAMSRWMAKAMMGVRVIEPTDPQLGWLVQSVHDLARRAQLPAMPEVGVFDNPTPNAFATGPTKSRSLVAVSSGLLRTMDRNELAGVLGHEIAHIQNGDMVTMTLIQGVVNAFVMFFARIIAFGVSQSVKSEYRHLVHFVTVIVLDIVFALLSMVVVGYFSRAREFRADKGGAQLAGRDNMIGALRKLGALYDRSDFKQENASVAALQISGKKQSGFWALAATHPPLETRIKALQMGV